MSSQVAPRVTKPLSATIVIKIVSIHFLKDSQSLERIVSITFTTD